MAVGQGALIGAESYIAVGRETTFGTYNTASAGLDAISVSMKSLVNNKVLDQIERSRTMSKRIQLGKVVQGDLEFYYVPLENSSNFILQNAFGGSVTTATVTGETTGGGGLDHTFTIGNLDRQSYPSLCLNIRKGDSTGAKIFNYSGVRANEITFSAALDEPLMCSANLIAVDDTQVSNDVNSALTVSASQPLSFVNGRLSVETSFASLTSTSFWEVQSVELTISNNLKADADSRRIGSNVLDVLPQGKAEAKLKCRIRFDTTTAYDAMIAGTKLSAQFEFLGDTISGSVARQGLRFNMPVVYINDAGDPSIGGPDEMLMSDVEFDVLRDDSSATGYMIQAIVTNNTSSYS